MPIIDRLLAARWQHRHHHVDTTIHPDDEMWQYIASIDRYPLAHYLDSGWRIGQALASASIVPAGRVLEFACGHGRYTRHLVLGPAEVTVSDIYPGAVQWVTRQFGVAGFVSTSDPADLDHEGRYDLIVVASLFSHLPLRRWEPWLDRLVGMLAPGGTVAFTANGPDTVDGGLAEVQPGFWYGPGNETGGRLDPAEYGTTHVAPGWVRAVAPAAMRYPLAVWGRQDLYTLTV